MPEFEVVWQMTGTMRVTATDDLDAKAQVDFLTETELAQSPGEVVTQVIATREVEAKK